MVSQIKCTRLFLYFSFATFVSENYFEGKHGERGGSIKISANVLRHAGNKIFISALQFCACLRSGVQDKEPHVHDFKN